VPWPAPLTRAGSTASSPPFGVGRGYRAVALEFDELKKERILVGSPAEVAERVNEYRDEFVVPLMWFRVYYPGMDTEPALEAIRMFGQEVIPLCRGAGERPEPAIA
jgi:alkanesulfonate monooxygenase SsuD/methylene tetrahydromethanopterin reductase-like flavin-dependent oxidoreductase (luciferase family)